MELHKYPISGPFIDILDNTAENSTSTAPT